MYPAIITAVEVLFLALWPSKVFLYEYRRDIARCMGAVVISPFSEVTFARNLMGDMITSLTRTFPDLVYMSHYLFTAATRWEAGQRTELGHSFIEDYLAVLLAWPYVFRLFQCGRRWYLEGGINHAMNGAKYVSGPYAGFYRYGG